MKCNGIIERRGGGGGAETEREREARGGLLE